jgi:hypothetical protein
MVGVAGELSSRKIKDVKRQTGQVGPTDFQGVSPRSSNRGGPPQKETAATAETRRGGETNKKALNLQSGDYVSRPSDAIGIDVATMQRIDIGVERADLIGIIDELHVIRAAANAAALVFLSRSFTPNHPGHFSALEELLNSIEEKTEALYGRLNDELDARRHGEGGAS